MKRRPIRLLIVEDSSYMRFRLRGFLEGDERFQIIGEATDGEEALHLVSRLKPDVMTLDLELPKRSGIDVLKTIMESRPIPILVVSALAKENAEITLKALELGAVDFVTKPTPVQVPRVREEFIAKLLNAADASLHDFKDANSFLRRKCVPPRNISPDEMKLVVIGASIGGPKALHYLMPQFPKEFPAPVLIVQHMPKDFTAKFAEVLDKKSKLHVKQARRGDRLVPGQAYLAPGGYHLVVTRKGNLDLEEGALVNSVKPSVDVTLHSAARHFKERVIALILTGMGKDGADGAIAVRRENGIVVAEAESSCVVFGMSRSVIEAKACDWILPLEEMCPFLLDQLGCHLL